MGFTLRLFLLLDWTTFYPDSTPAPDPIDIKTYNSTFESTSGNTYIKSCIFKDCQQSSSAGGGVYASTTKLLIEFSAFENCSSPSGSGGGISCNSNDFVCNCVCFYKCYASGNGQAIYTWLGNGNQNKLIESSVCSDKQTTGGSLSIDLNDGEQNCSLVNVSNNKVSSHSAIGFFDGSSASSLAYCSLNSNEAEQSICVYIQSGVLLTVQNSNIIQNTQSSGALFLCYESTTITGCCILGNTGGDLFSGSYTVKNCTLPTNYPGTTNAATSFIHGFVLTENGSYCVGEADDIPLPEQTPEPTVSMSPIATQSPSQSPWIIRFTCDRNVLMLHGAGSFLASSVFIVGIS